MKLAILRLFLGVLNLAILIWSAAPALVHPLPTDGTLEVALNLSLATMVTLTRALHLLMARGRRPYRWLTIGVGVFNALSAVLVGVATSHELFTGSWRDFTVIVAVMSFLALNAVMLF